MNQSSVSAPGGILNLPRQAQDWLDARGKAAWIAATVLATIFAWPVGLALLAYVIWSKRMFNRSSCGRRAASAFSTTKSSGNSAFDSYKEDTLRRLQEEQTAFEGFLERLRQAKDKQEFDAFMEDRARTRDTAPNDAN
ncbi:DUF2852 domain-containing protein [Falsirhodobacter sp. alg1]|uniref:DUF2852 domain-containing protein n=1 Tax=Falsirhodobacter sp. alg1 TaxID=1472418 RepID=UPI0005EF86CC|nr:DUF2852 domain-containing protein [Falsirhodobacter sp. alg1]